MIDKIEILSTKRLHASLVASLRQRPDIIYSESAFIETVPIPCALPDQLMHQEPGTAIVFTSGVAVECLVALNPLLSLHQSNIFCLEGNTRDQVIIAWGADCLKDSAGNAEALAQRIITGNTYHTIVFVCGASRRERLPEILRNNGINVLEVIVYETLHTPHRVISNPDAVLFFSPSAVHSFFSINQLPGNTICCAIGAATAAAILEYGTDFRIITAAYPGQESLLQQLFKHLQIPSLESIKK